MTARSDFRYCLNTSTIRACELGVEEEIKAVADAGYDGIELWVRELDAYLNEGGDLGTLRALLEDNGLAVPNLIAFFQWGIPDEDARRDQLDDARRVFQMAADVGCPGVAAPPTGIGDMEDMPLVEIADRYAELAAIGANFGVTPILEFWGHAKKLGTLDETVRVLRAADVAGGSLLADVFHMARGGSDFGQLAELRPSELGLFHVNDYLAEPPVARQSDSQRVWPGDGVAPFGQIVNALDRIGYTGMMSLELFKDSYAERGIEACLRTGIQKMRSALRV